MVSGPYIPSWPAPEPAIQEMVQEKLDGRVMCGWPPPCKGFVTVTAKRSLAVMCPAWLRGWIAAGLDGNRGSRPDQARGVVMPLDPTKGVLDPSFDRRCHHPPSPSQDRPALPGAALSGLRRRGPEILLAHHQCPGDARHLVGQGDGHHLGPLARHKLHQPGIAAASLTDHHRHGAIDQQPPQIAVAAFADRPQAHLAAGAFLAWHKPQAAKSRPLRNCLGSATIAAIALARIGPKPGAVIRCRQVLLARPQAMISFSTAASCCSRLSRFVASARSPAGSGAGMSSPAPSASFALS